MFWEAENAESVLVCSARKTPPHASDLMTLGRTSGPRCVLDQKADRLASRCEHEGWLQAAGRE